MKNFPFLDEVYYSGTVSCEKLIIENIKKAQTKTGLKVFNIFIKNLE